MTRPRTLVSFAVLAGALACGSDGTGPQPGVKTDAELRVVRTSADAPPLVTTSASFYARKGQNREVRMYYRPEAGFVDSTEFLRFKVPDESLELRPDGSTIAMGDSVLITVTVIDATKLIVDFQPAGLRFAATKPAELKLSFAEGDDDLVPDGVIDAADAAARLRLAIWRRETIADPWVRLSSMLSVGTGEVEADIVGFTNYAIAY